MAASPRKGATCNTRPNPGSLTVSTVLAVLAHRPDLIHQASCRHPVIKMKSSLQLLRGAPLLLVVSCVTAWAASVPVREKTEARKLVVSRTKWFGASGTVQEGIRRARDGDTVVVEPGTYDENIDFLGKHIVLRSSGGPHVTTLSGGGRDSSVVVFAHDEDSTSVLEGFTITGGRGSLGRMYGGGVFVRRGAPRLVGNVITGNSSVWGGGVYLAGGVEAACVIERNQIAENRGLRLGGGIYVGEANVQIVDNAVSENTIESDGGGIAIYGANNAATVIRNRISGNHAGDHGGGIIVAMPSRGQGRVHIEGNIVIGNVAEGAEFGDTGSGGGIAVYDYGGVVKGNTIVANEGRSEGPGAGGGLLLSNVDNALLITHNIFALNRGTAVGCDRTNNPRLGPNLLWKNTPTSIGAPEKPCTPGWEAYFVEKDPQFCNPSSGDYSVAVGSPAIAGQEPFGALSVPGCDEVSVERFTWGQLKFGSLRGRGERRP